MVTMKEVIAKLDPDEVDYVEAAKLGPDAIPHLIHLINRSDIMLASKSCLSRKFDQKS